VYSIQQNPFLGYYVSSENILYTSTSTTTTSTNNTIVFSLRVDLHRDSVVFNTYGNHRHTWLLSKAM